jgi:hypothetical protein
MGAAQNKEGPPKSLEQIVNFVATNYILTQNFQDMKNLSDMKYCNNLVILTSKVIEKKLSDVEIEFLAQQLKEGVEINKMETDKVKFFNKKELPNLDVKNQTEKRRLCIAIAKHYVKIAHVYAAIVTTIRPNYIYNEAESANKAPSTEGPLTAPSMAPSMAPSANPSSEASPSESSLPVSIIEKMAIPSFEGGAVEVDFSQKQNIPAGVKKVNVKINNLCSERINALLNNQNMSGDTIVVKPNFCKMNLNTSTNKTRTFETEPGIPELSKLYYDKYNFNEGGFTEMSDNMKEVYKKDVDTFYKLFTNMNSVPPEVKTFSDIPLRAFHREKGCEPNGLYTVSYTGSVKDKLFKTYADHIKRMMETTENNQNKLLDQIDKMFVFNVNPITKAREVTIKPNLTDVELQKIVDDTRKIIINLYITCEKDFFDGLLIFEAIVENQIKSTSELQINEAEKIVSLKLANSDLSEHGTAMEVKEVVEEPIVIKEKPIVVKEEPIVVEEKPIVIKEKPIVVEEKPIVVEEKPIVVEEKPIVVEEKPSSKQENVETSNDPWSTLRKLNPFGNYPEVKV